MQDISIDEMLGAVRRATSLMALVPGESVGVRIAKRTFRASSIVALLSLVIVVAAAPALQSGSS